MGIRRLVTGYSLGEEIAHSVTHGVGIVFSIAGLAVLVAFAARNGTAWHIVGCSVFGATLILLYAASTLYHGITSPRAKRVFQVLDHSAIYLLIAGTYTPFTLVNLRGVWGWTLFGVVWALAVAGVLLTALSLEKTKILSMILYVAMGWLVVVAFKPLIASMATGGIVLLVAGGVAYTLGLAFYGWRRLPYHHMVWHLFVMAGSLLHYFAVLFFVVPSAA